MGIQFELKKKKRKKQYTNHHGWLIDKSSVKFSFIPVFKVYLARGKKLEKGITDKI